MKKRIGLVCWLLCLLPLSTFAAEVTSLEEAPAPPVGQTRNQPLSAPQLFGAKSGYFHPFLTVAESYTDNYFNESNNTAEEWVTTLTPGIWLAFPGTHVKAATTSALNSIAGGQASTRIRTNTRRRFEGFAQYQADIPRNKNYSASEKNSHYLDGMLSMNLRGGLGVDLLEAYRKTHDPFSTGNLASRQLDEYTDNLASLTLEYPVGPKFSLRLDGTSYQLNYVDSSSSDRDRSDIGYAAYVYFKALPKTSLFLEYDFVNVNYDKSVFHDSQEHHYYAGLQWDITSKSSGLFKAGYSNKQYKQAGLNDKNDLALELQLNHRFTRKTSLSLVASRKQNQSDVPEFQGRLSHMVQLGYTQVLTPKITGNLTASYTRDQYRETVATSPSQRDEYYSAGAGISYLMQRWLTLGLGYNYNERSSNIAGRDYSANLYYLSLTASL